MSKKSNRIIFWFQYDLLKEPHDIFSILRFKNRTFNIFFTKKYCDYVLLLMYFNWNLNNS